MQRLALPWGDGTVHVDIPDTWRILGTLSPKSPPPAIDTEQACREALSTPIGVSRISERSLAGRKVALVVDDHSRPTPVGSFITPVIEEILGAGAHERDIEILIATGVHRASRADEIAAKLGPALGRFPHRCHDAHDASGLVRLGETHRGTPVFLSRLLAEADLIVCLGAVEPHLLLGYGGGLKMIVPGCAGNETIGANHLQGVDSDRFDYVGAEAEDSPMRQDLEEAALMLGKDFFIVNAALTEKAVPARFFCGSPIEAHRAAQWYVRDHSAITVPQSADIVITNSHPMDADLRQSVKCLGNTLYACRPGGVMLGLVRCREGLGEIPLARKTLPYGVMRGLLRVIGKNRIMPLVRKAKRGEPVEELFIGHFGLQMMRRNHLLLYSDSPKLPDRVGRKVGMARSFTRIGEAIAAAGRYAPSRPTAWVFPDGGASFAVDSK